MILVEDMRDGCGCMRNVYATCNARGVAIDRIGRLLALALPPPVCRCHCRLHRRARVLLFPCDVFFCCFSASRRIHFYHHHQQRRASVVCPLSFSPIFRRQPPMPATRASLHRTSARRSCPCFALCGCADLRRRAALEKHTSALMRLLCRGELKPLKACVVCITTRIPFYRLNSRSSNSPSSNQSSPSPIDTCIQLVFTSVYVSVNSYRQAAGPVPDRKTKYCFLYCTF